MINLRMYCAIGERNKIFTRQGQILASTTRAHLHHKRGQNEIGHSLRLYYAIADRNTIFTRQLDILKVSIHTHIRVRIRRGQNEIPRVLIKHPKKGAARREQISDLPQSCTKLRRSCIFEEMKPTWIHRPASHCPWIAPKAAMADRRTADGRSQSGGAANHFLDQGCRRTSPTVDDSLRRQLSSSSMRPTKRRPCPLGAGSLYSYRLPNLFLNFKHI